jgi:hypothetical protein
LSVGFKFSEIEHFRELEASDASVLVVVVVVYVVVVIVTKVVE